MANNHRLVLGLSTVQIQGVGPNGTWPEIFPKFLEWFDNDILVSSKFVTYKTLEYLKTIIDVSDRLYLDSGGFTLFKDEKKYGADSEKFKKLCESARRRFLKILSIVKPKEVFELDNEYFRVDEDLLSPRNYMRQEVKDLIGYYPTPVFKFHQGFEYWKRLCESDLYDRLAIGGFAQTRRWGSVGEDVKKMMEYARLHKKKVHLLGCSNIETFKKVQPDTVDYCIYQFAINITEARKQHPEWNDKTPFSEMCKHALLWSYARAKVRTYFYDSYKIGDDNTED